MSGAATDERSLITFLGDLEVRGSAHRGRGVFATRDYQPGELVEAAPVILFPAQQTPAVASTVIDDYVYLWGDDLALVLGYGSLYNHSFEPNARYERDFANKLMRYVAIAPIAPGTEITVNYNGDPACLDPLWFTVA